jgi:hypothetical protein
MPCADEVRMKPTMLLAVAVLFACSAHDVAAGKRGNDHTTRYKNVIGAWKGQTGCAGDFLFRADGTYELKGYGPTGTNSAGVWKVRWETLPPTLVLTCKASDFAEEVGQTTEAKFVRLDDESLAIRHPDQTVARYARAK